MCFAPQRRALFQHLNSQKCSENRVFCTFWLRNVLRATTACNFSSLIWPDGSAPAALASLLFDPPEPQIIGKTQCFATFLPFRASASSFFWLFLFSLLSSLFSLLSSLFSLLSALCSLLSPLSSLLSPLSSLLSPLSSLLSPLSSLLSPLCSLLSSLFSLLSSLFSLLSSLLSSPLLSSLLFSSLLADSSHLCFSSVHIVGSLTSKLPSNTTLQLQLHYNTLHYTTATATTATALHHTTSSSCGKVTTATTATIATTPENTTPTTCRSMSGFALPSVIQSNQPLL